MPDLIKTLVVTSFGRHTTHPLSTSVFRLSLTLLAALVAGVLSAKAISNLSLAADLPVIWAAAFSATLCFVVSGFITFALGAKVPGLTGYLVWPLNRFQLWLVPSFPILLIWTIVQIPLISSSVTYAKAIHQPLIFIIVASLIGSLASFVIHSFPLVRSSALRTSALLGLSAGFIWILVYSLKSGRINYCWSVFAVSALLPVTYLVVNLGATGLSRAEKSKRGLAAIIPAGNSGWLLAKVLRNRATASAFGFCMILSLFFWAAIKLKNRTVVDGDGFILLLSFICIAFAADVRGLTRKNRSLELEEVGGVASYLCHQLFSVYGLSLLVAAPLLSVLKGSDIALSLEILAVAVTCGLLGGTLLVPLAGEFGSQFMSAMIGSGVFWLAHKSFHLLDRGPAQSLILSLICVAVLLLVAYLTELRRRISYGHA